MEELSRTVEILMAATTFFAREFDPTQKYSSGSLTITEAVSPVHRICEVLERARHRDGPTTYYAARQGAPSKRALSDLELVGVLTGITSSIMTTSVPQNR